MLWTEGQSLGSEHSSASGGRQCAARGLILFPLLLPVSLTFHLEIDRVLLSFWLAAAGGSALEWAAHVAPCTGVSPLPSLLRTAGCRTSQGVVPVVPAPAGPGGGGPSELCLRMSALRSWQSAVSVCGAGAGVFTVSPSTAAVPAHQIWGLPAFSSPSPGPEQESQDHEEAAAQAQAGEEALRRGVRSEKK